MVKVVAAHVKELREKTGAGMMDCKQALEQNDNDMQSAIDWLRAKGLAAAAKKASRVAAEGVIAIACKENRGAIIEVNAETDFVARNEKFQKFATNVASIALGAGENIETINGTNYSGTGATVSDELTNLVATIGENLAIRRCRILDVEQGVVSSYIHSASAPGLGRIGVLVSLKSDGPLEQLNQFGKQIAMHVAAAAPQALDKNGLDPELIERERAVLSEQARESGKPENIIEKMVEGRLRKFYEEVVLMDQFWVIDNELTVAAAVEKIEKEIGTRVQIMDFVRFGLGEGIEKEESDFAAEVAAQVKG